MNDRYTVNFDTERIEQKETDVLIIGAGIAGMYTALQVPDSLRVMVLAKDSYKHTNSYRAQGGIACVMDEVNDSVKKHVDDTMRCGHYHNNIGAVKVLIKEGKKNLENVIDFGAEFDRNEDGSYKMGMEGAHCEKRILHKGDQTGAHMMDVLYEAVCKKSNVVLMEDAYVYDLLSDEERCYGVIAKIDGSNQVVYAGDVVLATGGIGRALNHTTNDNVATGDGIAMALRASVYVGDMNYLQYHPTVFKNQENKNEHFLISEAVRGEGAIILDEDKNRLMEGLHPRKDLAPRDVVSRAIFNRLKTQEKAHVYLDMRHFEKGFMAKRFPYIYNKCIEQGFDTEKDLVPIVPMMHYHMGGVSVDTYGHTTLDHLYAVGECSNTGVHGKNRLASNSLLEAIVFGNRVAEDIKRDGVQIDKKSFVYEIPKPDRDSTDTLNRISQLLNQYFVTKKKKLLKQLARQIKTHKNMMVIPSNEQDNVELYNMFCVIRGICDQELIDLEEQVYETKATN